MSLQFVMGPSGSGKSHYLYQYVISESDKNPENQYIILVPEQYGMQAKRDYVQMNPKKGMLNVDVLSFGRLAHRIFAEVGKSNQTVLDDVGKSLILKKVTRNNLSSLKFLGKNLNKIGYIEELKSVISEFVQYGIGEKELEQLLEKLGPSSNLYYKLQDISLIYKEFLAYLDKKYIIGEELLNILSDVVKDSAVLKGCTIVLDGFTGFTPVQRELLKQLLLVCDKVMISVTVDKKTNPYEYKSPYHLYALSKQTVTSLMEIAKENNVEVDETVALFTAPAYRFKGQESLQFLADHLFDYKEAKYAKEQDNISIYKAKNIKQEIELVAQKIRYLARVKGYRYRDIAVITPDLQGHGQHIKNTFLNYDIPVFMDLKRSILLNSFVEYIRSFLEMAERDFSYESVFRYLRTGLSVLNKEEVDILENYFIAS